MIETKNMLYNLIGINFPGTDAYKFMLSLIGENDAELSTSPGGEVSYSFPWGQFGVEVYPAVSKLVKKSYRSDKSVKSILEEETSAIKSKILDPIEPNVLGLMSQNYPGLEGIMLSEKANAYLVGVLDTSKTVGQNPLDMLQKFGKGNRISFNRDIAALNSCEESRPGEYWEEPNPVFGLNTYSRLSKLSNQIMEMDTAIGKRPYIFEKSGKKGFPGSIVLLGELYELRGPLEAIIRQ
jgi:hypothetical protein